MTKRQFLTNGIVAGSTICFGCSYFLSLAKAQDTQQKKTFKERITENSGMSYEQVFNFAFRDVVIPALIGVSENIGRDKLVEMFKEAGAPELGYAIWCYPDYAMAKSNNRKLERIKTLMFGDDYCYFKTTEET